jgi:Ca-activated chloride channel family protein
VLDTSGSMRGKRMTQARNALKYCLKNLGEKDRFSIINFATTVNRYADNLLAAEQDQIVRATKWVDELEATGGTAINDALLAALALRGNDAGRTFTVVFFTDGRPTIGETNAQKIQQNVLAKNNASTRIFTFGVGDDVNATMLDQLAEQSKALSTYVREFEDIESRVSGLYAKISNPVLANLKLTVGDNVKLSDMYPTQLPDLFHGTQLVVMGRYKGDGHVALKLTGSVGKETKEFVYELNFPGKTNDDKDFVEDLWARRKVGYLLDQIRINGQKKELMDEMVALSKRYGIATPYTSYLIVPDAPVPVAGRKVAPKGPDGKPDVKFNLGVTTGGGGLAPALDNGAGKKATTVTSFLQGMGTNFGNGYSAGFGGGGFGTAGYGGIGAARGGYNYYQFQTLPSGQSMTDADLRRAQETRDRWASQNSAYSNFKAGMNKVTQEGKLGVDLSCEANNLRLQDRRSQSAVRRVGDRNCLEVGGVWIDERFDTKMKTVAVKAQSAAYFRILERHAAAKQAFQLGNHVVWVTPSNVALVIDTTEGAEKMSDADIDRLFVPATPPKKK